MKPISNQIRPDVYSYTLANLFFTGTWYEQNTVLTYPQRILVEILIAV